MLHVVYTCAGLDDVSCASLWTFCRLRSLVFDVRVGGFVRFSFPFPGGTSVFLVMFPARLYIISLVSMLVYNLHNFDLMMKKRIVKMVLFLLIPHRNEYIFVEFLFRPLEQA